MKEKVIKRTLKRGTHEFRLVHMEGENPVAEKVKLTCPEVCDPSAELVRWAREKYGTEGDFYYSEVASPMSADDGVLTIPLNPYLGQLVEVKGE